MPIKDQCNKCRHRANISVCPNLISQTVYNSSPCPYYSRESAQPVQNNNSTSNQNSATHSKGQQPSKKLTARDITIKQAGEVFLDKAFDFSGRARRKEYWYAMIYMITSLLVILVIEANLWGTLILTPICTVICVIATLSITWRRLHDVGKPGTYYFLNFIPIVGQLVLLFYLLKPGDIGCNEYGPDPKYYYF